MERVGLLQPERGDKKEKPLMLNAVRYFAVLAICALAAVPARTQTRDQKPELIKVTDRVYCATGYALGNVIYVLTDKSVVVVDTTESEITARETLQDFRKVSALPVSHIIYTHHHGDHLRGARVFKGEATKVIAQKRLPEERAKYELLLGYNRRLNGIQFGAALPLAEREVTLSALREGQPVAHEGGYVPPDILFDDAYTFEEGGVRFELYHTQGETVDHLMVWLPQERVLLPGDLYYASFPMLASPMKPDRPVLEWARSLDRMRQLRPDFLVPSHWQPVRGSQEVATTLANYARAIRYVHDETVKRLNQRLSLDEIRQQVQLPEDLARLPYLAPRYGTVEWAVNGIYRQYTGWYDFNPARLNPGRALAFHTALLEASGGAEALLRRARQALGDGQPQLALELTTVILAVEPKHRVAHEISAGALQKLAEASTNTVTINVYRAAAQEHRKQAGK
jgi:alkyl sulfatase BDS1-like metallo-beta-lactamase superfamily hydrolase